MLCVFSEQHSSNCSRIINPFIPLSGWTVSPQWLIREWFCANKRDSKIPKSNPRRFRERISSVKATGNLITVVAQSRETSDTIIRVHTQALRDRVTLSGFMGSQENKETQQLTLEATENHVTNSVCVLVLAMNWVLRVRVRSKVMY